MPRIKAAPSAKVIDEDSDHDISILLNRFSLEDHGRRSVNRERAADNSVRCEPLTQTRAFPLTSERPLGETTTPGSSIVTSVSSSSIASGSKNKKQRKPKSSHERSSTTSSVKARSGPETSTFQAPSDSRTPTVCTSLEQSTEWSYQIPFHSYYGDDDLQHKSVSEYAGPVTRSRTDRQKSVKASEFEAGPAGDKDVKALPGIGAVTAANLAADYGFTKAKQLVCHYVTVCKESKTEFKKFLRTVGSNSHNQELCYQAVHRCAQEYM